MPYSRESTGRPIRVGVDGVATVLLERVGLDLVRQANAATFVTAQYTTTPAPSAATLASASGVGAAVTTQRREDVTGQALRVHPHEHVGVVEMSP